MSREWWSDGPDERERAVPDPDEGGDEALDRAIEAGRAPKPDPEMVAIIAAHGRNEHVAEPFRSLLNAISPHVRPKP